MLLSDSSPKILHNSRSLVSKLRRMTTLHKLVPFPWILSTSRTLPLLNTDKSSSNWSLCSMMLMMMNLMEILEKMMKNCQWSTLAFRWPRIFHKQHLKRLLLHPREQIKRQYHRKLRRHLKICREEELVRVRLPPPLNHKFLRLTETWDRDKVLIDQVRQLWCHPSEMLRERPSLQRAEPKRSLIWMQMVSTPRFLLVHQQEMASSPQEDSPRKRRQVIFSEISLDSVQIHQVACLKAPNQSTWRRRKRSSSASLVTKPRDTMFRVCMLISMPSSTKSSGVSKRKKKSSWTTKRDSWETLTNSNIWVNIWMRITCKPRTPWRRPQRSEMKPNSKWRTSIKSLSKKWLILKCRLERCKRWLNNTRSNSHFSRPRTWNLISKSRRAVTRMWTRIKSLLILSNKKILISTSSKRIWKGPPRFVRRIWQNTTRIVNRRVCRPRKPRIF